MEISPEEYQQRVAALNMLRGNIREPPVNRAVVSERASGINRPEQHYQAARLPTQRIQVVETNLDRVHQTNSINEMKERLSGSEKEQSKLQKQLHAVVQALMPSQLDDVRNDHAAWVARESKTLAGIGRVFVEMCFTEARLFQALEHGVPDEFNRLMAPVCVAILNLSRLNTPLALNSSIDAARELNNGIAAAVRLFVESHPEACLPFRGFGMGDKVMELCTDSLLAEIFSRTRLLSSPVTVVGEISMAARYWETLLGGRYMGKAWAACLKHLGPGTARR